MSYSYFTELPDRKIYWEGKGYLHFCGTSYLGMGSHPKFRQLLIDSILKHGPNHGSSRNSNVQLPVYENFEAHFASEAEAEAAALLSSGFMAGQLAYNTLNPMVDLTWTAPDTHPAISSGTSLPTGLSHQEWQQKCIAKSHELMGQKILLLSNAVNPLIPEIHDFAWTKLLSPTNKYFLLIDDSHAFGLLGKGIYGTFALWKNLPVELMVCGSLGKALALPAGIILGNQSLLRIVRENAVYRTSSPPAPAFLNAFLEGQDIYLQQQNNLSEHLSYMYSAIAKVEGFKMLPQYPVISFEPTSWVDELHQKGIIVSSFPYPSPDSPPINRIILSAWHLPTDLQTLVKAIEGMVDE
ncbi:aminotransferase class I/II-fold pyridoxal phosphate-dependent enzyme [Cyclobacterium sp. 1_MG-2023]|uniref:aminotransferase class I/II-fold pyridoxal phosphate-dependent enzyme n=1 Tax=Cyclobacterium sp. 1_MG-2023 TaxID=3062681 RepID=UPI0026E481C6|nr:aminotransferase class I/II-fold pyridoxal phosphate-dependent enzyme [Cyclobacterium sp. 1_MG-2023]MDO6438824.1 aminotransferase class I/II-fold pyridoxal phosphate-dependent enzyme [Cyclobacterium sp. 1_MG-2023]